MSIMESLFGFSRLLLIPISLVVATPIILVGALFSSDGFWSGVRYGYGQVLEFWDNLRIFP